MRSSSSSLKLAKSMKSLEANTSEPRPRITKLEQVSVGEGKPNIPIQGYMRLPAVLSVFPVSRSTWWAGISAGKFPKGVKLGPRITAWKVEDIRKLIESPQAA
jgi:prophage regulatory protein